MAIHIFYIFILLVLFIGIFILFKNLCSYKEIQCSLIQEIGKDIQTMKKDIEELKKNR
jgi:hypothetical protein